jgi:hypothetical protein
MGWMSARVQWVIVIAANAIGVFFIGFAAGALWAVLR